MQLYPAIDIKNGQCVRLSQGLFDQVNVYDNHPEDAAVCWEAQGATYLHVVDLDGALAGHPVNLQAIRNTLTNVSVPIEVGGGIRTMKDAEALLNLGVRRVIIGTKAVERPEFVKELTEAFGSEQVVLGVDAKVSSLTACNLCLQMKEYGIRHIVYTDISRDGMLSGPNVEATRLLTSQTGLDVIASGGVSSIEDLDALYQAGICGAIMGKSLYEKKINLREAVLRFQ